MLATQFMKNRKWNTISILHCTNPFVKLIKLEVEWKQSTSLPVFKKEIVQMLGQTKRRL